MFPSSWEYHIAPQVNAAVRWLLNEYGEGFDAFSDGLLKLLLSIQGTLQLVPWWGYIVVIAALTWVATKKV
ncbi:MAG: Binding-protein-dependent transport systems inner membrane component, partial [Synergistales bacterium 53_16]